MQASGKGQGNQVSMYRLIVVEASHQSDFNNVASLVQDILNFIMQYLQEISQTGGVSKIELPIFSVIISMDQQREGGGDKIRALGLDYCMTRPVSRQQMIRCLQLAELL